MRLRCLRHPLETLFSWFKKKPKPEPWWVD